VKENANKAENISIKYFTYNKEIGYADYIYLKDYERFDNLDEVSLVFQPASPVVFHIKNNVLNSLKYNQFSIKQSRGLQHKSHAFSRMLKCGQMCIF